MRDARAWIAAVGLVATLGSPARTHGQAVGFSPQIGYLPDGVSLSVTPAVSADRRYVRLSTDVAFSTVAGFQTFPFPGAVVGGGGGIGGGGGLGGPGGGGGLAVLSGMNGPIGPTSPGGEPSAPTARGDFAFDGPGMGGGGREGPDSWWTRKPRGTRARSPRAKSVAPGRAAPSAKKKP